MEADEQLFELLDQVNRKAEFYQECYRDAMFSETILEKLQTLSFIGPREAPPWVLAARRKRAGELAREYSRLAELLDQVSDLIEKDLSR